MKNKLIIWYGLPAASDVSPLVIAVFGPFETLQEIAKFRTDNAHRLTKGEKFVLEYLKTPEQVKEFC